MNTRIKELREHLGLSRAAFGDKLGISGDVVNNLERGRVEVKEDRIKLICSVFNVSEEWLRTGKGDINTIKDKNQTISEFAADLIKEPESFKARLFEAMAKLDEKDWDELEKVFDKLTRIEHYAQSFNLFTNQYIAFRYSILLIFLTILIIIFLYSPFPAEFTCFFFVTLSFILSTPCLFNGGLIV